MSAVEFKVVTGHKRLFITSDATEDTARIIYVAPVGTPSSKPITLDQIRKIFGGVICFSPRFPTNPEKLEKLVPPNHATLFIWTWDPDDFQETDCISFQLNRLQEHITKITLNTFCFYNSKIAIPIASKLRLNEDASGFTFSPPGGDPHFYLKSVKDGQSLSPVTTVDLCFPFAEQGILKFDVTLAESGLNALDVGLETFWNAGGTNGNIDSQRYPVFSLPGSSTAALRASMDPFSLDDSSRSYYAFLPNPSGGNPVIGSYYRTILGHEVTLSPQTDAVLELENRARLLFSGLPPLGGHTGQDFPDTLHLAPSGNFQVQANNDGEAQVGTDHNRLVCGLSGVEYIILNEDSKAEPAVTTITFVPDQPAFAQGFLSDDPDKETGLELTDQVTTSWVRLWSEDRAQTPRLTVYCAQPEDCVLYRHSATGPGKAPADAKSIVDNSLTYMEVPSLYLPAGEGTGSRFCFPMLPYSNVTGNAGVIGPMETGLISPTRKRNIDEMVDSHADPAPSSTESAAAETDGTSNGTTPQGFLNTYTSNFDTLSSVLLATTDPLPKKKANSELRLQNIQRNTPLWKALLTNQLFLVATDKTKLADYLKGVICIEDWQFDLDTNTWRDDTILVTKFFRDKTLYELAQDCGFWTHPNDFNDNLSSAKSDLTKAIQYAINQCCGITSGCPDADENQQDCFKKKQCDAAPDFEYFVYQVLLNPQWNGILAFNVNVPPQNLPDQLKCLAAGIKADKFYAHHIGVNASPFDYDEAAQAFDQKKSSVFGLIYYDDPALLAATGSYAFKVLTLKVLFQNSAISSFASRVDLQVNSMFGYSVNLQDGENNNLVFDGTYQDHDGHPSYVFTCQGKNVFLAPGSQVIKSVILDKGEFVTVVPESSGDSHKLASKFVFWGGLDFHALTGFDVFSFGSDGNDEGWLAFSNLSVEMEYDSDTGTQTFHFDPSHLSLDIEQSTARTTSLYSHFPLKLTGFLAVNSGTMPTDMGFMSVTSPLTQGVPTYPWYALTFNLELGSLGALAEKAGFTANLIVAWSPVDGGDYNVFLGLKLPGSSGNKKEISLEGLLKIKIKSIEFVAVPDAKKGTVSYMLRLQTISLGFLSLTFPPSGRTDFLLFGDPDATGNNRNLGWYAVYDKGAKENPKKHTSIPGFDNGATQLPARGVD